MIDDFCFVLDNTCSFDRFLSAGALRNRVSENEIFIKAHRDKSNMNAKWTHCRLNGAKPVPMKPK